MTDFIPSPAAGRDLEEIWEYIAADSIDAADRWLAKLEKATLRLAEMPKIGLAGSEELELASVGRLEVAPL